MEGSGSRSAADPVEGLGTPMTRPPIVRERPRRGEEGFALVVVLLALLVLTGIVATAVVAALGQLRAADMAGSVLAARAAARGGVERVLAETRGWPAAAVGDSAVELLAETFGARGSLRVRDLRIAREFHVLVAEADPGSGLRIRDARLNWWLEPETRVAAYRAVVEGDSVVVAAGARVLADSLLAGRRGFGACDGSALLARAVLGGLVSASGGLPRPPEWGAGSDGADFAGLRLGWFGRSMLATLADHDLTGGGTLPPGCSGCWMGLVFGSGNVRRTGSGAGVLAVAGDLVFASGSSWIGLVLASGNVTFSPGTTMLGMVRGGGTISLGANSVVDGSMCAALEALNAAASLARPIPVPARSWLGPVPPAPR